MQACRGSDLQDGEEVEDDDVSNNAHDDDDDIEDDIKVTVPNDADTLIAYATTPGKFNGINWNTSCMNRLLLKIVFTHNDSQRVSDVSYLNTWSNNIYYIISQLKKIWEILFSSTLFCKDA